MINVCLYDIAGTYDSTITLTLSLDPTVPLFAELLLLPLLFGFTVLLLLLLLLLVEFTSLLLLLLLLLLLFEV